MASFTDFASNYPRTTGIVGNVALGVGQNALERKLGLNDGYIDRYYDNSSGHPILGEIGSEVGLGLLNPATRNTRKARIAGTCPLMINQFQAPV